ncbi:E2F-associated phosphoprotein [Tachysurus fulvidraco]|uniref:E2F-associated phosphoprotein n=1 Tax=Tachysurus fulvidraco TaxID=1234273 RepID=UPI000F4EFF69|nr:E2F-associated phosphoprotein [Tachysurus fulvidraco]
MNRKEEYDSYEIEEPSDEERACSSSEDELDILLNGTPDQKKKLIREYLTGESESSSGDEFEKEMEAELSSTIKSMECNWTTPLTQGETSQVSANTQSNDQKQQPQQYDDVYFDTDSDEDSQAGFSQIQRQKQRNILTNDELLYDPDEDDRDQAWVDAKRKEYRSRRRPASSANRRNQTQCLPSSDAILNCPACMTTLCLDCQRHEKYRTQYRAMFVMNCTVKKDEVLRYKAAKQKKQRRKRSHQDQAATSAEAKPEAESGLTDSRLGGMDEEEVYHPVKCTECSTEVAVYDKDEVYHFFNILASHC